MTATATAAQAAPQAEAPKAAAREKGFWLHLSDADFESYVKQAKIATKRAEDMRARRLEHKGQEMAASAGRSKPPADPYEGQQPPADEKAPGIPTGTEMTNPRKKPADQGTLSGAQRRHDVPLRPLAPRGKADTAATFAGALRTRFIDPGLIDRREDWNPRFDFGDINELAESIRAQKRLDGHGLINDIRVKEKEDGRYELVDGDRRLTSVEHLMEQGEVWDFGIPAKVEPANATDVDLLIKMFEANQGKAFLPIEEAYAFKRLKDAGLTLAQIEQRTGRSDNSINGALALLEGDDDLVEAVTKGSVTATLGKQIAVHARGDKAKQKELVAKAKAAKGDKKKTHELKKDIETTRRAKIAKQFPKLQLKQQSLDLQDVNELGAKVGVRLKELMERIGLAFDTDMHEWVSNDRELQIAASFGALEALKAVMGVKGAKPEF